MGCIQCLLGILLLCSRSKIISKRRILKGKKISSLMTRTACGIFKERSVISASLALLTAACKDSLILLLVQEIFCQILSTKSCVTIFLSPAVAGRWAWWLFSSAANCRHHEAARGRYEGGHESQIGQNGAILLTFHVFSSESCAPCSLGAPKDILWDLAPWNCRAHWQKECQAVEYHIIRMTYL